MAFSVGFLALSWTAEKAKCILTMSSHIGTRAKNANQRQIDLKSEIWHLLTHGLRESCVVDDIVE